MPEILLSLISETRNVKIILPIDRKNGILVEPKFKKVFSMFFLCFHARNEKSIIITMKLKNLG